MAVGNSLAKRNQNQQASGLTAYLAKDAVRNQINSVVGGKNGPRFISSIVSAVQVNPALQECTNSSIVSAALLGESLNLSPSPQLGQYYMVPYDNRSKGAKEAQFQLGYKGYIQLAIRSGQYKKLNVLAIKEGELVRFDPLNEEIEVRLIEDEELREEAPTVGYYAMFEYTNGFRKALYWSKRKMLAHADKFSKAFSVGETTIKTRYGEKKKVSFADYEAGNYAKEDEWMYSSFWYKDFDGMAYKTMLRQLISKWGIMSIELQSAINADMAVVHEDGAMDYVDNGPEDVYTDYTVTEPNNSDQPAEEAEQATKEDAAPADNVEADFFN
ncbi:recombinase [Clostridium sp. OF09-36]|uniref:recombinase RecT n=1 Tax=Clostridium sp. OF09-36 TaxID=2292310 RepID=UPI000E501869|nr:recombinase RecT [Clostridium sp. OF09-36]RHV86277.1 recombinase [Clostridium sp. OF09-36]